MKVLEVKTVKGSCPLDCQDTCSWVAHVENGRVVKVEGAKDHPFTRGVLCAKVKDYEQRTYAPDRLLYPLRRTGPKGSGEFEQISWSDAIDEIGDRFTDIIAEDGPEALMPLFYLGSMGVVQHDALRRVFYALGATRPVGSVCGQSGNVLAAEGHPIGFDPEEIVDAQLVLAWGANLLTTSHHHWWFITEARRRHGARIVSIDPRLTMTAKASDQHISIRPGTDWMLAAGLAHVLMNEGLADLEWANSVAEDLDAYMEFVADWSPDRVAGVCGIDEETIVELGREYGTARPAVIRTGIGPQQSVAGEAFVRGVSALAILSGHWKSPGGGLFIEAYPDFDSAGAARPDLIQGSPRELDMARLGQILNDKNLDPPIKGLMIWNTNPAVIQVDSRLVQQGLARDDLFGVVVEHFLTDTATFADIVLPSTTQLEHFDILGAWGHHYISVNNPAIPPLGQTKSHGEIMRRLARKLELTHPALAESDEQIAAAALPEYLELSQLKADGWYKTHRPRPDFSGEKLTLTGPVPPTPGRPDGMLQLLTPKAQFFLNSSFANMKRQRTAMQRPTLDMHPEDATSRGLLDEQPVRIGNDQGTIDAWLRITEETRPGVVVLPGKWWSAAKPQAVANLLLPSRWSPGGQPAYNETYVEVTDPLHD